MKELIRAKTDETDALIRKIDSDRYKEELTNAKQEILALKLQPVPYAKCVSLDPCCRDHDHHHSK